VGEWSAATLSRWCAQQGDSLRTEHFSVATLLRDVDGAGLLAMSDYSLDELGVPARMRTFLRDKLHPAPAAPETVEDQMAAAEAHGREFMKRMSTHDLGALAAAGSQASRGSTPGGSPAHAAAPHASRSGRSRASSRPSREASDSELLVPPPPPEHSSMFTAKVVAGVVAASAGITALIASEKDKRDDGKATLADSMSNSVALPYAWAAESAEFGLEWVKKALQVGEGVPMVGAIFTLCLLVAQAAQAALANKTAARQLGVLAQRVAQTLAAADSALLERVQTGVAALKEALKDAVALIQSYSTRGWLRRLASAGGDSTKFAGLHARIRDEMGILQFDLQLAAPPPDAFRDESKALRATVLAQTGRTVEEGGLEELLKRPGGTEALHSQLGVDARVLSAELAELSTAVSHISKTADATLALSLDKELRHAVQLSVSLQQPGKRGDKTAFITQAALPGKHLASWARAGAAKKVAAFRVLSDHVLEVLLEVESKPNSELHVRGIERIEQAGPATYVPAPASKRRCWCGGSGGNMLAGLLTSDAEAVLFEDDDVDIPLTAPCTATLQMRLPDDAGPAGEVLTVTIRLWVSFLPSPTMGDGFAEGKTVAVTQTLYLAVHRKATARFLMEQLEDSATAQRSAVAKVAGTALLLPLMVHARHYRSTELLMRRQLVGWDGVNSGAQSPR